MKILANWSAKSNEQGGLLPTPLTRRHLAALGVVEELKQRLQKRLAARRSKEQISARARELWEQHGRPRAATRSSGCRQNQNSGKTEASEMRQCGRVGGVLSLAQRGGCYVNSQDASGAR
jgi:hypothetical protein